MKQKVLFVCVHNSARSQMAEAWLNHLCPDEFQAESAGFEPGILNPFAVQVMAEEGIDISRKATKSVFDVYRSGRSYRYVIAVCDATRAEKCPIFPGISTRLQWSFPDPTAATGSDAAKLEAARQVRDLIRSKVNEWCAELCETVQ